MSNQAKLLISALFIVAIVLCIGLTRFYFDVTKNTDSVNDEDRVASIVERYSSGMQVFESTNGFYGILDAEGSIVVEPEWMEVLAVTSDTALVSRRIQDEVLIGGIDYEENVVLPFAFRSMIPVNDAYYIGVVAEDESCIIYNADFEPVFQNAWTSAEYDSGVLALEKEGCFFSYYLLDASAAPVFRRARMQCSIGGEPLSWSISNKTVLSEFDAEDLLRINAIVPAYIDMLIENDFSELASISSADYLAGLSKVDCFPGFVFDEAQDFSFSAVQNGDVRDYDFAFTLQYHQEKTETTTEDNAAVMPADSENLLEQSVKIHLYFRRNTENQLILTSANLDFHNTVIPVTEAPGADAE